MSGNAEARLRARPENHLRRARDRLIQRGGCSWWKYRGLGNTMRLYCRKAAVPEETVPR